MVSIDFFQNCPHWKEVDAEILRAVASQSEEASKEAWSLDIAEPLRPIGRESTSRNLRFLPRWQTRTEPRSGATI